jgi:hypothetical protein
MVLRHGVVLRGNLEDCRPEWAGWFLIWYGARFVRLTFPLSFYSVVADGYIYSTMLVGCALVHFDILQLNESANQRNASSPTPVSCMTRNNNDDCFTTTTSHTVHYVLA